MKKWEDAVNITLLLATVVIVGIVVVLMLLGGGCTQTRPAQRPDQSVSTAIDGGVCGVNLSVVPMLCDEVTLDGKHECAICAAAVRCISPSGVYCAASCDDKNCRKRSSP